MGSISISLKSDLRLSVVMAFAESCGGTVGEGLLSTGTCSGSATISSSCSRTISRTFFTVYDASDAVRFFPLYLSAWAKKVLHLDHVWSVLSFLRHFVHVPSKSPVAAMMSYV